MKNNKPKTFALDGANDISQYAERIKLNQAKDLFQFANGVTTGQIGTNMASQIAVDFSTSRGEDLRSLSGVAEVQQRLLRDYNDELIKRGIGMTRKDLRKKDTIDIRNLCYYTNTRTPVEKESQIPDVRMSDIKEEYLVATHWFNYVPCFNEGVLQLNAARYIHWKIENINVVERKLDIFLQDYLRSTNVWQIGVSTKVHYEFDEKPMIRDASQSGQMKMGTSDSVLFSELYRIIPTTDMHWSKSDIDVWNNIVIAYADSMVERLQQHHNTNNAYELAKLFTHFILLANQELYANKPKAIRKNTKSTTTKRIVETDTSAPQPRKLVRTVGKISMQSEKPPKMPTRETVVHYKTAVWKARGGIRRMKNGKLVPFKESVRHRKCLQGIEDTPQVCINFATKKKD